VARSHQRRAWIRQATSLLREPWPRDEKLCLALLSCALGDRWAQDGLGVKEAGRALLSEADVMAITGLALEPGRVLLRSCSQHVTLSVTDRQQYTQVDWPKWVIFQGIRGAGESVRAKPPTFPTLFPEGGLTPEQKAELAESPSMGGVTPAQFRHACLVVADWSHAGGKTRVDWVATTRNAILRGWALEGFGNGAPPPSTPRLPMFPPATEEQQALLDRTRASAQKARGPHEADR